jgi:hypothetical protein
MPTDDSHVGWGRKRSGEVDRPQDRLCLDISGAGGKPPCDLFRRRIRQAALIRSGRPAGLLPQLTDFSRLRTARTLAQPSILSVPRR